MRVGVIEKFGHVKPGMIKITLKKASSIMQIRILAHRLTCFFKKKNFEGAKILLSGTPPSGTLCKFP